MLRGISTSTQAISQLAAAWDPGRRLQHHEPQRDRDDDGADHRAGNPAGAGQHHQLHG
jgi:hypothetical protein